MWLCNCALLLLHATAVKSFDGLVQLCTQKYIASHERGCPLPPLNLPMLMHVLFLTAKEGRAWVHGYTGKKGVF